jgi:nicotinamidase-related amidase
MDTHPAFRSSPAWSIARPPLPAPGDQPIDAGEVRPSPAMARWLCDGNYPWLLRQVRHYCEELERAGKYRLYLWPPHCLLGSDGHALAGVVHEARLFHSFARGAQSWVEVKGGHPLTENYSVMAPEVLTRHDGRPLAQRNTQFLKTLLSADAVLIAGQAASHCVKSSIDDILGEIVATDPDLAKKVY